MKPGKRLCYMFLLAFFGLDRAQTTIGFEMCWSNWPIDTFLRMVYYSVNDIGILGKRKS